MTQKDLLGKITYKVDRECGGIVMPEKIEQLLKKIHILFAKSDKYMNSEDQIIVSKKEMFQILEELNYAIYEMMDQYEMTQVSKEQAKAQVEKETEKMIGDAHKSAEDIYAASIMYSDNMLSEVKKVVQGQIQRIHEEYHIMEHFLESRVSTIMRNRDELHEQLQDMADDKLYLKIIEEQRKRDEIKRKTVNLERDRVNNTVNTADLNKTFEVDDFEIPDMNKQEEKNYQNARAGLPDIKVDVDHVAKVRQAALAEGSNKNSDMVPTAKDQAYSSDDLDAEYYKWKQEQEPESNTKESGQENQEKIKQIINTIFGKTK